MMGHITDLNGFLLKWSNVEALPLRIFTLIYLMQQVCEFMICKPWNAIEIFWSTFNIFAGINFTPVFFLTKGECRRGR
jgi:hypothetical protein